ncbi:hypothetical protein ABLE68_03070 [Nocardioides sp. CN2-186]|uniref:hypothetical protein n=1 Tax=Nocardioides tweenelious TaxID=3156607 RepID=UPI0032B55002
MSRVISRPGVVVPVRLDPSGRAGPTPGQARGSGWRRVGPGLYVPSSADGTSLDQRIVEAVLGCPGGAGVTGWAGLAWQRGRWFRANHPVPIALGDSRQVRARPGVTLSEDWLFADDVVELDGLPLTRAERSVSYEVRRAWSLHAAVQVIDMAAYDDLVDIASLTAYASRLRGRPGTKQLRHALRWADENAWSPQEVIMRLYWRDAHPRTRVWTNRPIFDLRGNHMLTPDLLDVEHGVAGEYDGAVHLERAAFRRDLNRDALYRDLGIELVTMMSADTRDVTDFLARLRGAYRRAAARTGAPRSWTVEQPDWWVDTSSVAARRTLSAEERAIWLRRRAA